VRHDAAVTRIGIIGGGPGGYEAALVAAQLGGEVVLVDRDGIGGSCVLTDCVPSKTLIATADVVTATAESGELGVVLGERGARASAQAVHADLAAVNARVKALAAAQSADIAARLEREGVRVVAGVGRLEPGDRIVAERADGGLEEIACDVALVSTGARPRVLADAEPDGEGLSPGSRCTTSTRCPSG